MNFIKGAIKKPGALRETVQRRYGPSGFTQRGTIKQAVVHKLAQEHGKTGQRARFAEKLRGFNGRRGR